MKNRQADMKNRIMRILRVSFGIRMNARPVNHAASMVRRQSWNVIVFLGVAGTKLKSSMNVQLVDTHDSATAASARTAKAFSHGIVANLLRDEFIIGSLNLSY
jgi:hypothetical protein